ncbi:MAG: hypothetical protein RL748_3827, partial [Pseudomonadota bacterium]
MPPVYQANIHMAHDKIPPVLESGAPADFTLLSPEKFEEFCTALVRRQPGVQSADKHGTRGQADNAVDVLARREDGGFDLYQCKNYKVYTIKDLNQHIAEFKKALPAWQAQGAIVQYVLMISSRLEDTKLHDGITQHTTDLHQQHGIAMQVWSGGTIETLLATHPQIVHRFFGEWWVGKLCNLSSTAKFHSLENSIADLELGAEPRKYVALAELQAWSNALASEVDVAGHKRDNAASATEAGENTELRLSDGLFVQRKEGQILTSRIDALLTPLGTPPHTQSRVFIIKGEAGHGKTSLLWWLHQRYHDHPGVLTLFLRAAWLGGQGGSIRISADRLTTACELAQSQGRIPLILIDTVDLLVRSDEDASVLIHGTLARLQQHGAIVVLTTRPQEARRLKSPQLTSTSFDLTAYDDTELQEALTRYAERYYRSMGQPSTLDVAQHFARIERAVAQGKPVKQICTIPLALRMLFEIYAPDSIPEEIHIVDLYQAYWRNRVEADVRAAHPENDSPAPASGTNHAHEAMWLATQMLVQGSVELEADSIAWLFQQKNLPQPALDELLHRGILQRGPGGSISFFHQTFFEHAAARALLILLPQSGLKQLGQRVADQADDLFIKPILQNALLLAEPVPSYKTISQSIFTQLLAARDIADQTVALYVYCHWKRASPAARVAQIQTHLLAEDCAEALHIDFLRFASNLAVTRSSELLPLLGPLWQRQDQALRRRKHILTLLARLAWRWPVAVSVFLNSWKVFDYVFHKDNVNDDITVTLVETAGNAWLQAQAEQLPELTVLRQSLLDCLHRAMTHPYHFSLAQQVAILIGRGERAEINTVLQICQPLHESWNKSIADGRSRDFIQAYCALWVRIWDSEQRSLEQSLAQARQLDQAALTLHLITLANSLMRQDHAQ